MNLYQEEDIVLPFTATHTGRRAKIGYLGIDGSSFNDLWPFFLGVVATVTLSIGLLGFVGRRVLGVFDFGASMPCTGA